MSLPGAPLLGLSEDYPGQYLDIFGTWDEGVGGIRVTRSARRPWPKSSDPYDGNAVSPERYDELWGRWTFDNPPPISQLRDDVLAWEVTQSSVLITSFDHERARGVLLPYYGDTLVLLDPPYSREEYALLDHLTEVAETDGVLQAVGPSGRFGFIHPHIWLQRITANVARAALPIPEGLPALDIQVHRGEPNTVGA